MTIPQIKLLQNQESLLQVMQSDVVNDKVATLVLHVHVRVAVRRIEVIVVIYLRKFDKFIFCHSCKTNEKLQIEIAMN
jgi:hypothetical protein